MKIYLVGGAVRDELLGLPSRERDWVVIGATPKLMLEQGYRRVGKDFPVFLHPDTNEEYALARTERKTGTGYHGFEFDTGSAVTLEQDLGRRDLTINAMAKSASGELIDPFGGSADLKRRLLRHVTDSFREDPVRVLRVARFAARFRSLGFRVHDETMALMRAIVADGEAGHLQPDRVWRETARALTGQNPRVFFEVLREAGALALLFPEIDRLFGVPQPARWHPEIDTGLHTMMVLEQSAFLSPDIAVRFAALTHDLGKGETPADELPSHAGHEQKSVRLVADICNRLPIPNSCRDLALLVAELHGQAHRIAELKPATAMRLLEKTDALRRPGRFEQFVLACEADSRGRTGLEDAPYPPADILRTLAQAAASVSSEKLSKKGFSGKKLGEEIRRQRLEAIARVLRPPDESVSRGK